jgi:predicted metalloprotease with PDZ domain
LRRDSRSVTLPDLPPDSCLEWRVDLAGAAAGRDQQLAIRIDNDLLMSANLWFWKGRQQRPVQVSVTVPPGMSFSTPWPRSTNTGDAWEYVPRPTSSSWKARIAVGRFPLQLIKSPGTEITLAALGDLSHDQRERFTRWISDTVSAVTSVYGRFPQTSVQVLVVPAGRRSQAVPWAHVLRGGGPAVEFFVDETRSLAQFKDDWTATHEFSHLLLPYVSSRDRWLSEGMASYYQNVLRARNGNLTERDAWQKLHNGFQRGEQGTRDRTLADAVRSGRGATMRIYWTGAALMLMADTRLRALSDGRQSLDTALAGLQECCLQTSHSWRAREVLSQLDQLTTGPGISLQPCTAGSGCTAG